MMMKIRVGRKDDEIVEAASTLENPENPMGTSMVSSAKACAAYDE